MMYYVVGNGDMIIWWWFFFSFVCLFFSFSPNCWHNTTTKFRAAEHTHIHSEHCLCFLPQWSTPTSHCQSSECVTMLRISSSSSFSFICCYSNCKESDRVCVYLRCAIHVSLENEWLFHRYQPVGYIHRCHHTYIHSIGENRKRLFAIPHAPILPLYMHISIYIYLFSALSSLSHCWYKRGEREKNNGWVSSSFATNRMMHDVFAVRQVNTFEKEKETQSQYMAGSLLKSVHPWRTTMLVIGRTLSQYLPHSLSFHRYHPHHHQLSVCLSE